MTIKGLQLIKKISSLFLVIVFSGCQFLASDITSQNSSEDSLFTVEDPYEKYTEFIPSKPQDPDFYLQAYAQSKYHRPMLVDVAGGIVPNNPDLAPDLASYFHRLHEIGDSYDSVVIIARNYTDTNRHSRITTDLPYETPEGILEPDMDLINFLTKEFIVHKESESFKQEKIISFYSTFLKATFPQARITPILIEDSISEDSAKAIGRYLARHQQQTGKKTFVLAVTNFSNHPQFNFARFQTRYARSQVEAQDLSDLEQQNLESPDTVFALSEFLKDTSSQRAIYHTKGMTDRGYLMEYFTPGKPQATPEMLFFGVGDVMLDRYVRTLMERKGNNYPFEVAAEQGMFSAGHLRFINLEGPVSTERPRKGDLIFKFDPAHIDLLLQNNINLVSLANNHTFDQGAKGFKETKDFLNEKKLNWTGHPTNDFEDHVFQTEVNGLKITVLGLHGATIALDITAAVEEVKRLKPLTDVLIVTPHWGVEYRTTNSTTQQSQAHQLIDAGADAIIGHHPHVVQNIEWYNNKPIIYSLGNFIFDQYFSRNTQKGLGVGLIFSPNKVELYEFPLDIPKSQPQFILPEES